MKIVKIELKSRVGNQLFQFAYSFLIATRLNGIVILSSSFEGYKLDFFRLGFWNSLLNISFFRKVNNWIGSRFNYSKSIKNDSCLEAWGIPENSGCIKLEGYFQNGRLLEQNQELIKKKIKINRKSERQFEKMVGQEFFIRKTLVIHIRRGDYKEAYFSEIASTALLPFDWFNKVMKQIPSDAYDLLYVVSDDIKEVEEEIDWDGYNPIFFNGSVPDDFQLIMNADIAIISNSSFAWWAAFLNPTPNKKIFAPKNWVGYHVNIEYPKGIMIDQFTWVD
jgi:hypothetical protein